MKGALLMLMVLLPSVLSSLSADPAPPASASGTLVQGSVPAQALLSEREARILRFLQHAPLPIAPQIARKPAHKANQLESSGKKSQVYLMKNVYKSGFSRPHPERCPAQGAGTRLLILVTSAPEHTTERDGIRASWGRFAKRTDVAIAFVVGQPPEDLLVELETEDDLHGDLVMAHSRDVYQTLPLKTLSILEWAQTYCRLARFLFKTDDDVFVSVPNLLRFIDAPERTDAVKTIYGRVWSKGLPKRNPSHKHYLPWSEYSHNVLPDYISGAGYLITRDAISPLLKAALEQRYMRLEDIFITGVCANTAGVKREHVDALDGDDELDGDPCVRIITHEVRGAEQVEMWKRQHNVDFDKRNVAPTPPCEADILYPVEPEAEENADIHYEPISGFGMPRVDLIPGFVPPIA